METVVGSVSLCNWGAALDRAGEHEAGARVLGECCALQRKLEMGNNVMFAINLSNLALALRSAGNLTEAVEQWEAARHVRIAYGHQPNADVAMSLCHLAAAYSSAKRFDLAAQTFEECQGMRRSLGLQGSPEYVDTLHAYGVALKKSGETQRAMAVNEEWRQTKDRMANQRLQAELNSRPMFTAPTAAPSVSPSPLPKPKPTVTAAPKEGNHWALGSARSNVYVALALGFGVLFFIVLLVVWMRKPSKGKHKRT